MDIINKAKGVADKLTTKLPEPVKHLISLNTNQERQEYLETLPKETLQAIMKWFTYILLAGDLLGKASKLKITIPSDVRDFLERVDREVKKTGKLTIAAVDVAVEKVQTTIKVAIAIPFIIFGALLILNPGVVATIFGTAFVTAVALETSTVMYLWFSQRGKDKIEEGRKPSDFQ